MDLTRESLEPVDIGTADFLSETIVCERWENGWLAEVPGEMGLELWEMGPTEQVARLRLRSTIRRWVELRIAQAEAARR